jgi:HD-GYP domain-containing protein (c-di-GMP phosphodiesterase class II)
VSAKDWIHPMEKLTLRDLAGPIIKSIDSFNFLLKSHHRRTTAIAYQIGKQIRLNNDELFELVVAASLHDIGALSIHDRDQLTQEDVIMPLPHCIMGSCMLAPFAAFQNIAQIIRNHHIKYYESLQISNKNAPFQSHIINLADRVDIFLSHDSHNLNLKLKTMNKIKANVGTIYHPKVFNAFEDLSGTDQFWTEINSLDISQIFLRIDSAINFELSLDNIVDFALILSRIIDYRCHFTAAHSYTVAHLSGLLGEYFGFSSEKCTKLLIAGYLHDLGKIGIDPRLLDKPGPLSDQEFNIVKQHAYYTGQILNELNSSEWFLEIITWAERHHEKSDGSGYPYGLDDSKLDVGTKILAFADIISALMEDRPYRKKLSIHTAFEIIRNNMASFISPGMFQTIERHGDQINELIIKCQAHTLEQYKISTTY